MLAGCKSPRLLGKSANIGQQPTKLSRKRPGKTWHKFLECPGAARAPEIGWIWGLRTEAYPGGAHTAAASLSIPATVNKNLSASPRREHLTSTSYHQDRGPPLEETPSTYNSSATQLPAPGRCGLHNATPILTLRLGNTTIATLGYYTRLRALGNLVDFGCQWRKPINSMHNASNTSCPTSPRSQGRHKPRNSPLTASPKDTLAALTATRT
ncbi:Hypothetical predicted protein [Pelobates cultripes]|uniref:Uncharacterized protein n=1 Tax=Pelobates cultripes TaxID=61616 RepID=A0AAD1RQA3_PELCU|nr:Hypothetical predicted protein [Pelobates cultripes]